MILIWVKYGSAYAFKAASAEELQRLVKLIDEELKGWACGAEFAELDRNVRHWCDAGRLNHARRELMGFVKRYCQGHESFEIFEFTELR